MTKAPDAFRTISEVADLLQTPQHVLRFWESKFPQVRPVKRAGGRRYYRPADVALLGGIRRLLHEDGLTIRGVKKLLTEKGARHVAGLCPSDVIDLGAQTPDPAAPAPAGIEAVDQAQPPPPVVVAVAAESPPAPLPAQPQRRTDMSGLAARLRRVTAWDVTALDAADLAELATAADRLLAIHRRRSEALLTGRR